MVPAIDGAAYPGPDVDADYEAELVVDAAPEAVFEALTTLSGLAGWWSSVSGSGETGGTLRFTFGDDVPCLMEVTAAERPSIVRWTCLGYAPLPDWAGTTLSFDVLPLGDGGSVLKFRHTGLTPRLACYGDCKSGWDHFLPSLGEFAESGEGHPFGSSTDVERRKDRDARSSLLKGSGQNATRPS